MAQKAGNQREDPPVSKLRLEFSCQINPRAAVLHEGSKQNPVLLRVTLHLHSDSEMPLYKDNLVQVLPVGMFG